MVLQPQLNAQKPGEQKGLSSVLQVQFQVGTHTVVGTCTNVVF